MRRISAAVRGWSSSLSWRAESPVQMTKSISSLRCSAIQSKVASTREKELSQPESSVP